MDLQTKLEEVFAANFVSYYRAHVAHVNVQGRNFYQDHKLLQKIYEYFQDNIDTLAEKLRTIKAEMPADLMTVLQISPIMDSPAWGSSTQLFEFVDESLETMIDQYKELYEAAELVDYIDISNFAQDQIGQLAKFRWMVEATTGESEEE
jgi:DNA-binding ferritin-like protein